jgi:hypothetical protein
MSVFPVVVSRFMIAFGLGLLMLSILVVPGKVFGFSRHTGYSKGEYHHQPPQVNCKGCISCPQAGDGCDGSKGCTKEFDKCPFVSCGCFNHNPPEAPAPSCGCGKGDPTTGPGGA